MTATLSNPPRHRRAARFEFPYATAAIMIAAGALLGGLCLVSPPLAAIVYCPLYMILAWYNPSAAVWLMFAEVAFPGNLSGSEELHTAPAEISLVLAGITFWVRSLARTRPRQISNPILLPIVIYFCICGVSTFSNWTGRDAIVSFLQMVLYLVFCVKVFASWVPERRNMYAGLYGLIAACTLVSFYLVVLRTDVFFGVHKNATGTFLSYTAIILLELWLATAATHRHNKLLGLVMALNLAGLVMSTSRGAWIGAVAGWGVILVSRRQYRFFARSMAIAIPAILLCWFMVPKEQRDYALDFARQNRNIGSRYATIDFYKQEFQKNPGIGMGIGLRKEADSTNIIMSTLGETGVAGLVAFFFIHVCFYWAIYKAMRVTPRNHPDFTFLVLAAALVLCLFMHGLVDHYWSRTQVPVWAMVGAALAVFKRPGATFAPPLVRHPLAAPVG